MEGAIVVGAVSIFADGCLEKLAIGLVLIGGVWIEISRVDTITFVKFAFSEVIKMQVVNTFEAFFHFIGQSVNLAESASVPITFVKASDAFLLVGTQSVSMMALLTKRLVLGIGMDTEINSIVLLANSVYKLKEIVAFETVLVICAFRASVHTGMALKLCGVPVIAVDAVRA